MAQRSEPETFMRYEKYLQQPLVWPSATDGVIKITNMVPRHAASALAKLVRWSQTHQAWAAMNIYMAHDRERVVRNSMLGKALAARAQDLPAETVKPVTEVTPREIILAFAPVIAEKTKLNITEIFALAEALATKMDEELDWTITAGTR